MKKSYKIFFVVAISVFAVFCFTGCDVASVALFNNRSSAGDHISRSSVLWSGTTINTIKVDEDNTQILFSVEMKEGEVTFILEDEGEEIYNLQVSQAGTTEEAYTVEHAGTYRFIEKGKSFNGSYTVNWEQKE